MGKIMFQENASDEFPKGKELQYKELALDMQVYFKNEKGESASGRVSKLFTNENEEGKWIIGCEIISQQGDEITLLEEDNVRIWLVSPLSEEQPVENPSQEEETLPNLFQANPESINGKAQFPDWDIVPPNQFINPRIKATQ